MDKIKVGVFGAYRGKTMIKVLANHPNAELVAVCDKYRPLLDEVQGLVDENKLGISLYEDFESFFLHDMDAVVLANYANEHAPYAVRLLKCGRHVLSEVLPCETMSQAVELIEAVEESGKVYAYAENYCYMKGPFEMWRRYESGDIGEVQYAEGEYIHDCSNIWPQISYGERDHWRNRAFSTFYNTHSLGPITVATGRRPVRVTGFETNIRRKGFVSGINALGAVEMVTLDNGAVVKSIHGGLKREPGSVNYQIYGSKGMMETNRWNVSSLSVYMESDKLCKGDLTHYDPEQFVSPEMAAKFGSHSGSDYYPTHFFIEKILGNPDGEKYSIDVCTAVDMGICGILAYRSILNGGFPVRVPNLRNKDERDEYRDDRACTNPAVAGDQLLPVSPQFDYDSLPDEVFDQCRRLWEQNKEAETFEADI